MPFPNFLMPPVQSTPAAGGVGVSALGGGSPNSQKLNLSVEPQQQTNWCWAAVSKSVSHFYSAASAWTQCTVANAALPRTDCCAGGAADPLRCNTPWYLDRALHVTGNFVRAEPRSFTFAEVQAEIARKTPLGTRVEWTGGGGAAHFQTIVGWLVAASGTEYINVSDPIYLDNQIAFTQFASGYQSGGTWTHSYVTTAPVPAVAMAGGAAMAFSIADPNALGA